MPNDLDHRPLFVDRSEAAQRLIEVLPINLFELDDIVVVAISEGGVYFADKISDALKSDMDILLTEQILAPNNQELAIAIVSETEEMVMNKVLIESFDIDIDYVYSEANRKYEEAVLSYVYRYRKSVPMRSLTKKQVILVDESIESGLTMSVAIKSMIEMKVKSIYVAAPVLDYSVYDNLLSLCDGLFCPHRIRDYISIEYYYEKLEKLEFEYLEHIIEKNGISDYKRKV
ncbi:hypothetical protein MNB_SV-6-1540 [hydrothermal vent metagenome]|uniref:Phosphoribosyltransferase domain-containing protein n=1 Tax=hydrothermal vent metagenome TaxID=652676 RepID=A0A1W1CFC6_9ZZZZ